MPTQNYWRFFVIIFLGSILFFRIYAEKELNPQIKITLVHHKLNLSYGGKTRVAGGYPVIDNKELSFSKAIMQQNNVMFVANKSILKINTIKSESHQIVSFFLSPNESEPQKGKNFLGICFDSLPGMIQGITFYRYDPWTEQLRIHHVQEMKPDKIQFFYWQYADGMYGAAMPLSGKGYRTTLGQEAGKLVSKSISYFDKMSESQIPQIAIGFGKDPYELFAALYKAGLQVLGKSNNLRINKRFPKIFDGIGWCSWNGSDFGGKLNEDFLLQAAKSFHQAGFPLKWILIDDGWLDETNGQLNSFHPNKTKFPDGFLPMVRKLKKDYQIADVGIWHTLDGYWRGINPNSPLGKEYENDLIPWGKANYFISPNSDALMKFYDNFYSYLKTEEISFVKVDNQVVTEDMAVNNFPIFKGAEKYHEALNASASKYFNNAFINCMDMTPDAYLNFGNTAVARAEEDYFPIESKDINDQNHQTRLKKAANHIEQAIYNSLYFSQMIYPDFDMFESAKPDSTYQAIARAINDGPIYVTDKINEHNFNVLFPLVYSNGTILRPTQSLLPTEDCLFQLQDSKPFKAFSMDGTIGLLGVWNISNVDSVTGTISPSDIHGIKGNRFAIYEYFSKKLCFATKEQKIPITLSQPPYRLYYILPLTAGNAIIGLINKYNAPAAIISSKITANTIYATLYEGGAFAAATRSKPKEVLVNGKTIAFHYADNLLTVNVPTNNHQKNIPIKIQLL